MSPWRVRTDARRAAAAARVVPAPALTGFVPTTADTIRATEAAIRKPDAVAAGLGGMAATAGA